MCEMKLEAKYVCGVSKVVCGRQLYTCEPDYAGRAGMLGYMWLGVEGHVAPKIVSMVCPS